MRYLIIFSLLASLTGCSDDYHINYSNLRLKAGIYNGNFQYDTLMLWESFGIKADSFVEYASGGVMNQKYPLICLTTGTYNIISDSIGFYNIRIAVPPDSNISDCDEESLLMGYYYIGEWTDSTIMFWKNAKKGKQQYYLKVNSTGSTWNTQ